MSFQKSIEDSNKPLVFGNPLKIGSLVTGLNSHDMLGLVGHRGHLFRVASKAKKVDYSNSGYTQDVFCILCRKLIQNVDCEFTTIKPTESQLERFRFLVVTCTNKMLEAQRDLRQYL